MLQKVSKENALLLATLMLSSSAAPIGHSSTTLSHKKSSPTLTILWKQYNKRNSTIRTARERQNSETPETPRITRENKEKRSWKIIRLRSKKRIRRKKKKEELERARDSR
jgi:hypothetical protein